MPGLAAAPVPTASTVVVARLFAAILFVIVPLLLLFDTLTGVRVLAAFDHLTYLYPNFRFAREVFSASGSLPMWNPRIFGGMPFVESLGPSLLYPTDLLCWFFGLSPERTFAIDALFHLALAAWGMHGLLAMRGFASGPASAGAMIYMLGGAVSAHLAYGTHVFLRTAAWLPWMFLATEMSFAGRRRAALAVLAGAGALASLALGYQILAYAIVVLPAYVLLRRRIEGKGTALVLFALALVLAAILSAAALLPCARYYFLSLRAADPHFWPGAGALPFSEIALLFSPFSWTAGSESLLPGQSGAPHQARYLGLLAFGLAVAGFSPARSSRTWGLVGPGALVLSLGLSTPLGRTIASLPPFSAMRTPAHWLVFTQLAIAVLAADAIARIRTEPRNLLRRFSLVMLISAAVFLVLARTVPDFSDALGRSALLSAGAAATTEALSLVSVSPRILAAAVGILAVLDLAFVAKGRMVTADPAELAVFTRSDPVIGLLPPPLGAPFRVHTEESHLLCNFRIPAGLEMLPGYHGAPLTSFVRFFDSAVQCPDPARPLGWLNARYIIARDPLRYPSARLLQRFRGLDGSTYALCENPSASSAAFFADRLEREASRTEILRSLCEGPRVPMTVFADPWPETFSAGRLPSGRIVSLDRTANKIEATVRSAGQGFVVFSEVHYPAWSAYVDGERARVFRVNLALRGVAVTQGLHRIVLRFESLPFKIGLLLSSAGWAMLGSLLLAGLVRNRGTSIPG